MGVGSEDHALPPPSTISVHSNSKSNMPGRINDRGIITLARADKTLAPLATSREKLDFTMSVRLTSPEELRLCMGTEV